ncbi:MAG: TetR/AcrR family transcriptional regulator [Aequoribacter sp.]|uniref:TetR/AcrR family transcriptional regulator n=1 Tax=Aequoribacter sp. TaxID=2847771 RepID=UPI003C47C5E4
MQGQQSKRGRRPNLSRAKIVEKTLSLLNSSNPESFSVRKLAQELGVTPAAIYVYFSGQDDLLRYAAEEVASRVELDKIPSDASWRDTLKAWAYLVRANHRMFPHATMMLRMSQHIPTAWFRVIEPVWTIFGSLHSDESKQIELTQSFIRSVAGLVLIEIQHDDSINTKLPIEPTPSAAEFALPSDPAPMDFVPKVGSSNINELFEQSLNLLLDGIEFHIQR